MEELQGIFQKIISILQNGNGYNKKIKLAL